MMYKYRVWNPAVFQYETKFITENSCRHAGVSEGSRGGGGGTCKCEGGEGGGASSEALQLLQAQVAQLNLQVNQNKFIVNNINPLKLNYAFQLEPVILP